MSPSCTDHSMSTPSRRRWILVVVSSASALVALIGLATINLFSSSLRPEVMNRAHKPILNIFAFARTVFTAYIACCWHLSGFTACFVGTGHRSSRFSQRGEAHNSHCHRSTSRSLASRCHAYGASSPHARTAAQLA